MFCSFDYDLSYLGSVVGRNTSVSELRLIYYPESEFRKEAWVWKVAMPPLSLTLNEITGWIRTSHISAQPTGGAPSLRPGASLSPGGLHQYILERPRLFGGKRMYSLTQCDR